MSVARRFALPLMVVWLAACASAPPPVAPSSTASPAATDPPPAPTAIATQAAVSTATRPTPSPLPSAPTAPATPVAAATASPAAASAAPSPTPGPLPPARVELSGAQLPPGFSLLRYADIFRPTSLAFDAGGRLYVTSFNSATGDGELHLFVDADGDGRADAGAAGPATRLAAGFSTPLGVAVHPESGAVYLSSAGRVDILRDTNGDRLVDSSAPLVTGLPFGRHQNDNLKFGPDGFLYMGIGSTCDACVEADARSATMMRFDPDSGAGEVIATGLRNAYDLAFHPLTGDLFATDNGRDDLGPDLPHEELNRIVVGGDYGWPACWDDRQGRECAATEAPVAMFEAHASANSVVFYTGDAFPPAYENVALVAILGSWIKEGVATGLQMVRLTPRGSGYDVEAGWFAQWPGRPLGLAVGPDGALYVGDYENGAIYRLSYGLPDQGP